MNLSFLAGKKTYLTAVLTILFAGVGVVLGYVEPTQAGEFIWLSVMFILARLGITKSGTTPSGS